MCTRWVERQGGRPVELTLRGLQFFLRTTDEEVEKYLKIFTFIRVVEIEGIMQDHKVRRGRTAPFTRH
jgi:tyrosyl-tRNA synthetase